MKHLFLALFIILAPHIAHAACPAAPTSGANDTIIRFVQPSGNYSGALSAGAITDKTLEGTLIYDTTNKALKLCDGTAWQTLANSATVTGPASSTNNAIPRFNGTTGKILKNSAITIDDQGSIIMPETGKLVFGGTHNCEIGEYNSATLYIKGGLNGAGLAFTPAAQTVRSFSLYSPNNNTLWLSGLSTSRVLTLVAGTETGVQITGNPNADGAWITATSAQSNTDLRLSPKGTGNIVLQPGTGNVGVKTTSPAYTLHVNGDIAATAFLHTSDERLKTNIQPLNHGLDTLSKLRPVSYEWKDQDLPPHKGTKIGFIAQEVEVTLPEIVYTANDETGTKTIAYSELVPVLINAIQELQAEIDALKKAQNH